MHSFRLDVEEEFENLPNAPIVEAVIHWQARATADLQSDDFRHELKRILEDYSEPQPQYEFTMQADVGPGTSTSLQQQNALHGYRCESSDKLHVAQFTRDGFVFSRLKPYKDWKQFASEGRRLWDLYAGLAKPIEIQRLEMRFINLITPVQLDQLDALLAIAPGSPEGMQMPMQGMMYQTTYDIPEHPYGLNVIQTIQPPNLPKDEGYGLILDINVFTTQSLEPNEESLEQRLAEMRWIKNKAFFTFLKKGTLKRFK